MNLIEKKLFETKALKISESENPFWYASGTFGPFYMNTHFLFGGQEEAVKALEFINEHKKDKFDFPGIMTRYVLDFYNENKIYKEVIDEIMGIIKQNFDSDDIDYISGGERRDWFFSYIIAYLLQKPHLTIYKNLTVIESSNGVSERLFDGEDKKAFHIADLVTEASSYFKYWIPALERVNVKMSCTLTVVDRQQGGTQKLTEKGIKVTTVSSFSRNLFESALKNGEITVEQYEMIKNYMKSPNDFMCEFVSEYPDFLRKSIDKDERTRKRAIAFIKKSDY